MKKLDGLMINRLGRKALDAANEAEHARRILADSYFTDSDLSAFIDSLVASQADLSECLSVLQDESDMTASFADCNGSVPLIFCIKISDCYYRIEMTPSEVRVDGYDNDAEQTVLEAVRRCFYEA